MMRMPERIRKLGALLVRYADDFVVLCKRGTDQPMQAVRVVLSRLELTLNETKTKVVDALSERFDFLGYAIRMEKSGRTGRLYAHVQPARKSIQKIKDRITALTSRSRTVLHLESVVGEVNTTLRGWVNYFHYGNCSRCLEKVRAHVEQRIRTHLCKRHGRTRYEGYHEYPNCVLYSQYGLYKVPTSAGWSKAHALK